MTLQPRILIVDDEPAIREMLVFILRQYQYQLYEAENISQAQQLLANIQPDLILLDWMLPGGSGIDLLRQLKREASTQAIPVVMLTAKTDEDNKVQGLEFGADDYINKPFSPKELVARIRAVLRRVLPQTQHHILTIAGLNLDTQSHRVYSDDQVITLGPTEFKLLHFFMSKPDRVYNREQLLNHVWGLDAYIDERTIDVHIRRLRKALVPTGHDKLIQTVRGSGYRLSEEPI